LDSGENRRIDFVFSLGGKKRAATDKVVALEIKYISTKKDRKTSEIKKLLLDEEKLKKFDEDKFHRGVHSPAERYIMLLAKKDSLEQLCEQARQLGENEKNVFKRTSLMRRLCKIVHSDEPRSTNSEDFGEIFYSPYDYTALWCVMVFFIPGP
jgi:hypothetical protein